ncbi:MAG: heme NO-binding domain-containing protein [Flavobacteriia bacterium]|nr:heme NO-binding domain-containing protein [Flavobacteriia bacterium]
MYGIVNKAIQELVTENFGEMTWLEIKKKAGINDDFFLSNESYPDGETFKLVVAASETLKITPNEVLIAFGEHWVLKTGGKHYGALMQSGGNNFKDFFINLPNFHSRVMLIYPSITPPEFKIIDKGGNHLELHYYSQRSGLQYFVYGLIQGLGKMFETVPTIEIIKSKNDECDHDEFSVKW